MLSGTIWDQASHLILSLPLETRVLGWHALLSRHPWELRQSFALCVPHVLICKITNVNSDALRPLQH